MLEACLQAHVERIRATDSATHERLKELLEVSGKA